MHSRLTIPCAVLGIAVLVGVLDPAPAGPPSTPFEQAIETCQAAEFSRLDGVDPQFDEGGDGALRVAQIWANCARDVAEDVANGALEVEVPDERLLNDFIKKAEKAGRHIGKALAATDHQRAKFIFKAQKAAGDLRLQIRFTPRGLRNADDKLLEAALSTTLSALEKIDELNDLVEKEGLPESNKGRKALGLLVVAEGLLDGILPAAASTADAVAAADAVSDEFGVFSTQFEDVRKQQKTGLKTAFVRLDGALRAIQKADRIIAKLITQNQVCELSDPDDPFDGGGWVKLSVDGGPEQTILGETGLSIFTATRHFISVGTQVEALPYVVFHHSGRFFKGKGTYRVDFLPSSFPEDFKKNFFNGFFRTERIGQGTLYKTQSGTLAIKTYSTSRKNRLITGSFDVIMGADGVADIHLTGTFHLCRFAIEKTDSISFPK